MKELASEKKTKTAANTEEDKGRDGKTNKLDSKVDREMQVGEILSKE